MTKKHLLILLIGLLALSVAYAVWQTPRQKKVVQPAGGMLEKRRPPGGKREPAKGHSPPVEDDLRVRLDLLHRNESGSVRPRRDLFAPLFANPRAVSEAVAEVKHPLPSPPVLVPEPLPVVAPPVPPLPPPAPPVPPVQFAFLGFLQKEVQKTVFLSAEGEIYTVKKGDRFGRDRQFTVADLTAESLVIKSRDNQPIVISLAEADSTAKVGGGRSDLRPARPSAPSRPGAHRPPTPSPDMANENFGQEQGETPPAEAPAAEQGIMRPLPSSNFNNIFSEDKRESRARPVVPAQSAHPGIAMPSEEVPR